MNKRPFAFSIVPLFLMTVVASSLTYFLSSGVSLTNPKNIYLIGVCSGAGILFTIAAFGVWRPRPYGYLSMGLTVLSILVLDFTSIYASGRVTVYYIPDLVMVLSGIFILGEKKTRRIFFDASIRWWERAKRYALRLSTVAESEARPYKIEIVDMSLSGCLLSSSDEHPMGELLRVQIDENFILNAVVVRKLQKQYGLKFEFKNWKEKRRLKTFLNRLDKMSTTSNKKSGEDSQLNAA